MTDLERKRFEMQGRALVARYGTAREVSEMRARMASREVWGYERQPEPMKRVGRGPLAVWMPRGTRAA